MILRTGAALFLDMHLPGSGSEPGSKPAVAAAWRLLADALHAEAASLQAGVLSCRIHHATQDQQS